MNVHIDAGASDLIVSGVVLAVLGFAGRFVWRIVRRELVAADHQLTQVEIPTPPGQPQRHVDLSGVDPHIAEAISQMAQTLTHVLVKNGELERSVARHAGEKKSLIREVVKLRNGIADGTIPPVHAIPDDIKHMLNPTERLTND